MSEQIPRLEYLRTWEDPADFPTHQTSEVQNRRDLQSLFAEIRSYVNDVLLPVLEQRILSGGVSGGGDSSGGVSGDYLPLNGGTMRGVLRLYRDPKLSEEAATRNYVDSVAGTVKADADGQIAALVLDADQLRALVQNNSDGIATLTLRADSVESSVRDYDGRISTIRQLVDSITLEVSEPVTDGENVYARITLSIGEGDDRRAVYGRIALDGQVDVSGELSAQALYAAKGEIADLAVDQFTTSRRIVLYLAGDRSDDNFIRMRGQKLEFVTGRVITGSDGKPVTSQAANPSGDPLYWPVDVKNLPRADDGYPRTRDGQRIFTTTVPTDYPVSVYAYSEQVKRAILFERNAGTGIYEPRDVFGAGNDRGYNRAYLDKTADGLELQYVTPDGNSVGIQMDAAGFVDIIGLRRPESLDFSALADGVIREKIEGQSGTVTTSVEFDSLGRPVRMTGSDGFSTVITW